MRGVRGCARARPSMRRFDSRLGKLSWPRHSRAGAPCAVSRARARRPRAITWRSPSIFDCITKGIYPPGSDALEQTQGHTGLSRMGPRCCLSGSRVARGSQRAYLGQRAREIHVDLCGAVKHRRGNVEKSTHMVSAPTAPAVSLQWGAWYMANGWHICGPPYCAATPCTFIRAVAMHPWAASASPGRRWQEPRTSSHCPFRMAWRDNALRSLARG